MILIELTYLPDESRPPDAPVRAATILAQIDNTQIGWRFEARLRPGETVSEKLRLDACGIVKIEVTGEL